MLPWVTPVTTVEMELAGVGAGWTDVSADLADDHIEIEYGIRGYLPDERTAPTGFGKFALVNDFRQSGGVLGKYSLYSTNKLAGFKLGIRVRIKQTYAALTPVYWMGTLNQAVPEPGEFEGRHVFCVVVDWMDEAARSYAPTAIQLNKRSDEVFSAILANIAKQPAETSIDVGVDTYPIALDNVTSETKAMEAFGYLGNSELAYIFVKRSTVSGQKLIFENRHTRPLNSTLAATLDNTMFAIDVPGDRQTILNKFRVITHPRRISASIVVAQIDAGFTSPLLNGDPQTIFLDYTDPVQRDTKIGAYNQIAPVATTDYLMNSAADGTGINLTASLSVTPTYFGSTVMFVLANSSGTPGYVTKLQLRGDGIYTLNPVTSVKQDNTSIADIGENPVTVDMYYQSDPGTGTAAAEFLENLYGTTLPIVKQVSFIANQNDTHMNYAFLADISSLVSLVENVSGITGAQGYYINGVKLSIDPFETMEVTWWLTPSNTLGPDSANWQLGTAGFGELGVTTRLGFL
jgi:hypothetical protein